MKILFSHNNNYALRFDKGEEVISLLTEFARENNISFASFTLIGASKEVTLSYYNLETKSYEDKTISEDMEILSVIGNIAIKENAPFIHAHGVFGRRDLSPIGGHIKSLTISATGEMFLTLYPKAISREYDEETGLFLLSDTLQKDKIT